MFLRWLKHGHKSRRYTNCMDALGRGAYTEYAPRGRVGCWHRWFIGNSLTRACLVVCVTRSYEGSARIWQRRYTAKPPALKLVRELGETAAPRIKPLGRNRGRVCLNAFQRGVWHITPLV